MINFKIKILPNADKKSSCPCSIRFFFPNGETEIS